MSYSIYTVALTGPDSYAVIEGHHINPTYNLSAMFAEALLEDGGLRQLHMMKCADALPHLEEAIAAMKSVPEWFRPMEPRNGWGTYEDALWVLNKLYAWCCEHPYAYLQIT